MDCGNAREATLRSQRVFLIKKYEQRQECIERTIYRAVTLTGYRLPITSTTVQERIDVS